MMHRGIVFECQGLTARRWDCSRSLLAGYAQKRHGYRNYLIKAEKNSHYDSGSQGSGQPVNRPSSPAGNLNERQREAVTTTARVVRVKAGPGSGKTRVVVARAAHLIDTCGVAPDRILAITFTNKAADELKERLEMALGDQGLAGSSTAPTDSSSGSGGASDGGGKPSGRGSGQVLAKTFHGLGAYILRRSLKMQPRLQDVLGLDARFKVMNADYSWVLVKRAVEEVERQLAEAEKQRQAHRHTPGQHDLVFNEPLSARELSALAYTLADLFGEAKTALAAAGHHEPHTAEVWQETVGEKFRRASSTRGDTVSMQPVKERLSPEAALQYYTAYQKMLRQNNAVDFSDLICLPVRLLDQQPHQRETWRGLFDYILVDEFQDTDAAQYRLVRLLLANSSGLFVVGDPDQAIYGWRGAEVSNMQSYLARDFPRTTTYTLNINYRSVPEIINAADALLRYGNVPDLYERQMPARPPAAGQPRATAIRFNLYASPEDEAKGVVKRILAGATAAGDGGSGPRGRGARLLLRNLKQFAILYRRRDQSRLLEEELTRNGLPYIVLGGYPWWSYKEIADAVAYLHVVLDPLRSDTLLERIINEPKRGLGDSAVASLSEAARAAGISLGKLLFDDLLDGEGGSSGSRSGGDDVDYSGAALAPMSASSSSSSSSSSPAHLFRPPSMSGVSSANVLTASSPAAAAIGTSGPAAGNFGDLSAASYAPDIPASSPLAAVKLKKPAHRGLQELRGFVRRLRALADGGETVSRLVEAAVHLSGLHAALQERANETAEVGKAAAERRKKKDSAAEAGERLERLESLKELAARPDAWLAANNDLEDDTGMEIGLLVTSTATAVSQSDYEPPREDESYRQELDQEQQQQQQLGDKQPEDQPDAHRGFAGLSRFLEHAALVTAADTGPKDKDNTVRLMTLHTSKGLEWQSVFIVGVEDGIIPSWRAEDAEEERRLFYVGVTRAMDELNLSACAGRSTYGERRQSQLSPFLRALTPDRGFQVDQDGADGYGRGVRKSSLLTGRS